MRVAYHGQIFWQQEVGGISRYFARLAGCMRGELEIDARIYAPLYVSRYLDEAPSGLVVGARMPNVRRRNRIVQSVNSRLCWPAITLAKPDLIHETYYWDKAGTEGPKRVVTVHDMIYEKFPAKIGGDQVVANKRSAIERADAIICVSEWTRQDLPQFYPNVAGKSRVISLATDLQLKSTQHVSARVVSRPYVLFVGMRGWYKNFKSLLTAYSSSRVLRNSLDLIAVGGGEFTRAEAELIKELGLADRVRQVSASDEELVALYQHAAMLVYPSLYEGFGLPPLEAMAAGCPVLCSPTSSLPEVCGPAAAYADCSEPENIRDAAERLLSDEHYRSGLIESGFRRVEKFSWRRCAEETLDVYKQLSEVA